MCAEFPPRQESSTKENLSNNPHLAPLSPYALAALRQSTNEGILGNNPQPAGFSPVNLNALEAAGVTAVAPLIHPSVPAVPVHLNLDNPPAPASSVSNIAIVPKPFSQVALTTGNCQDYAFMDDLVRDVHPLFGQIKAFCSVEEARDTLLRRSYFTTAGQGNVPIIFWPRIEGVNKDFHWARTTNDGRWTEKGGQTTPRLWQSKEEMINFMRELVDQKGLSLYSNCIELTYTGDDWPEF